MNVEQWQELERLLKLATKEAATDYTFAPELGAAYAIVCSLVKRFEREEREGHAHRA